MADLWSFTSSSTTLKTRELSFYEVFPESRESYLTKVEAVDVRAPSKTGTQNTVSVELSEG